MYRIETLAPAVRLRGAREVKFICRAAIGTGVWWFAELSLGGEEST